MVMHSAHTNIRMIQYLSCLIPSDHGVDLTKFSGSSGPFTVNDQRLVGSFFWLCLLSPLWECETGIG